MGCRRRSSSNSRLDLDALASYFKDCLAAGQLDRSLRSDWGNAALQEAERCSKRFALTAEVEAKEDDCLYAGFEYSTRYFRRRGFFDIQTR